MEEVVLGRSELRHPRGFSQRNYFGFRMASAGTGTVFHSFTSISAPQPEGWMCLGKMLSDIIAWNLLLTQPEKEARENFVQKHPSLHKSSWTYPFQLSWARPNFIYIAYCAPCMPIPPVLETCCSCTSCYNRICASSCPATCQAISPAFSFRLSLYT